MKYHFNNRSGWLGNPCGMTQFKGKYHAFFQHYPHANRFGIMYWGHCVSSDLITWEEAPIALSPEFEYENGGCRSGSCLVVDGRLWLFYTSLSSSHGKEIESVSAAYSEDGNIFIKAENNPIVSFPLCDESDRNEFCKFRDPYVFKRGNWFYMIVGAGMSNVARILLFRSKSLLSWEYVSELLSDAAFGSVIECPELFELDGRWVLMIQSERSMPTRVLFATGEFDGEHFKFDRENEPFVAIEKGKELINPVTFEDDSGRRLFIGWLASHGMGSRLLSSVRELTFDIKDRLIMLPADELIPHCINDSRFVAYEDGRLRVSFEGRTILSYAYAYEPQIMVLEDVGTVEIFINGGAETISVFIC